MAVRRDFVPRTWGRWTCMVCRTDGIGGLNSFYLHYYQEHETEKGKTNVQ